MTFGRGRRNVAKKNQGKRALVLQMIGKEVVAIELEITDLQSK